jgi:hypothetical protein
MSAAMRTALRKILNEGKFPGISNRLSPEDQWSPKDDELRTSDRTFLQTWIDDYADDPAWEKLIAAANRFQKSDAFDHLYLIWYALRAWRLAEDAGSGVDPLHAERHKRHEKLLGLAMSADALTGFWRDAQARAAVLWSPPFRVPFKLVLQLQKLNEAQAEPLRQMAGTSPPVTPISRQSRGKRRDRTQEIGAFMRSLVDFMREVCSKPRYDPVATLANIAFPGADVSADDDRAACQLTTRAGRTQPQKRRRSASLKIRQVMPKVFHRDR